ncbi:hypothetical protein FT663_00128 [Candidozyma haemuli var. vulneris]|uniref:Nucleolar protein 12 n=1 Tax=Candidozyma haemuli TaxID=45357 RepID=A0A2V1AL53_9ASCO|nr:hypothetical protein CXQ85_001079 [[Candida] haemuloni]KAF3994158.1 hypothetical protein FT662_00027 [[Candida] haemuloni var. vulneris]KAF3995706.1 hypothetical protein FT663_00128 [[Candida] haemuloni var. vulneris]PVH18790.1 hypothetical protein CXQ85_001079 [[Candida] haemuloni]
MSSFSALFSGASKDKTVESMFGSSAGPVDRNALKTSRTVIEVPEEEDEKEKIKPEKKKKKERKSKKKNDEDEDLEAKYYSKLLAEEEKPKAESAEDEEESDKVEGEAKEASEEAEGDAKEDDDDDSSEEEEEEDKKSKKVSGAKSVDLKEGELDKAERTVFVGNVPAAVITSKKTYKNFKKQFQQVGSVQAIRFRSIAFDEALPRKLAFAKKALHNLRDTVNAYVVFKEKEPSQKACNRLNATLFEHHHLRVDHVAHPAPKDNKRTIFVGNLDFEEQEENLWRYFNKHTGDDVESVRVVRDSKTNLGKGFALVQFKDTLSVNKAILLHDKPMDGPVKEVAEGEKKKKQRKLRISRAKANTKPSTLSPNHVDNARKHKKPKTQLTDDQKTKLGRARTLLGKSDRNTAGKIVAEGARATKGSKIAGIKGLKSAKGRVKKPRITDRSTRFKKDKNAMNTLGNKK